MHKCHYIYVHCKRGCEDLLVDKLSAEWTLCNGNGSICIPGRIPGNVHLDLLRANVLKEDPLFGFNELHNR